jgi:hypothetical protein
MFILTGDRDDESRDGYAEYRAYLEANQHRFPPGAYALATSDWYFGFADRRGPHDAWLREVAISEADGDARGGCVSIRIRLLNGWGDGHIELSYSRVHAYRLDLHHGERGHRDWRYDEFRLTGDGHLLHEIEWWSSEETGTWLIEADDVEHRFTPLDPDPDASPPLPSPTA